MFFSFNFQSNQQGNRRCFGEYKCPKCSRTWQSGYSWRGIPQQCERCRIDVLAHTQSPLRMSDNRNKCNPNKEHRKDLCGMCQLGEDCTHLD